MRRLALTIIAVAVAALSGVLAHAQSQHKNQERGFNANGVYSSFDIDSINLFNGNVVLHIPVGIRYPVGGRLSYQLHLTYNSNMWSQKEVCTSAADLSTEFFSTWVHTIRHRDGTTVTVREPLIDGGSPYTYEGARGTTDGCYTYNEPHPASNAGLGWSLTLGSLFPPRENPLDPRPQFTEKAGWVYQSPDGAEHTFYARLHEGDDEDGDPNNGVTDVPNVYYTRDGSYLRMKLGGAAGTTIEFPNGEKHYFQAKPVGPGPNDEAPKLVRIEDQFGNQVNIAYADDGTDADALPDNLWTITDTAGRSHQVRLGKVAGTAIDNQGTLYQSVVKSVSLEAFGPDPAVYDFDYAAATLLRKGPHVPDPSLQSDHVTAPFLTAVTLPTGARYSMDFVPSEPTRATNSYDIVDDENYFSQDRGVIRGVTLPTGARIEWEYTPASPDPAGDITYGYRYALGSAGRHYHRWSHGVRRRIVKEGSGPPHVWRYTPRLGPIWGDNCGNQEPLNGPCGRYYFTNQVEDPVGNVSKHYFSVYAHPVGTDAGNPNDDPHISEYGLPFSKHEHVTDHFGRRLYLSQEISKGGVKRRSVYVRYEKDQYPASDGWGSSSDVNARLAARRTVFHDDGGRYAEQQFYDFDGLGHYRWAETFGNFGSGDRRIEVTTYNMGNGYTSGKYFVEPTTNRPGGGHSYSPFPVNRPWVLGNYARKIASDFSNRSTTYFLFDEKGSLLGKRVRKDTEPASTTYYLKPNDVLVRYAYSTQGNLISERYFGGDRQRGLSDAVYSGVYGANSTSGWGTDDHASAFNHPANAEYTVSYTYPDCGLSDLGVVRTAQYAGVGFKTVDNDVNCKTGLVSASRDISGNQTTYFYDTIGRLSNINRQFGSHTQVVYSEADPNNVRPDGRLAGAPSVEVRHKSNNELTVLDREEYRYDQLGRLITELVSIPGGISKRENGLNILGWKTSVSEWIEQGGVADGRKTTYGGFDPFGRPDTITLPDGKVIRQFHSGIREVYRKVSVGGSINGTSGEIGFADSERWERYDQFGRLYQVEEQSGADGARVTTVYAYNVNNKLAWGCTYGAAVNQCRSYGYDNLGNLRTEGIPEREWAQYTEHDTQGNVGVSFDGAHWLRHGYDPAGRPLRVDELSDGVWRAVKEFTYHPSGAPGFNKSKLATSTRHNFVRNPFEPGSTFVYDIAVTEAYTYDGLDGRLSRRRTYTNIPGDSPDFEQTFEYHPLGHLSRQTYPACRNANCTGSGASTSRALAVDYAYQNGSLTGVTGTVTANGATYAVPYASSIQYHINQTVRAVRRGNSTVDEIGLDPHYMQRPARIQTLRVISPTSSQTLWDSGQYGYDGGGNITRIGEDWYLYDRAGRLKEGSAIFSSNGAQRLMQRYVYDEFGNILRHNTFDNAWRGTATLRQTYTTGVNSATNRLDLNYDGAGNLLGFKGQEPVYTYDAFNMIVTAPGPVAGALNPALTYLYGPNEERFWVIDNKQNSVNSDNVSTFTLRGLNNEVLREYVLSGENLVNNWAWRRDYVYRGDKLLASETPEGVWHHHVDHLGSTRVVTDAGGAVRERAQYLPFGENYGCYDPACAQPWGLNEWYGAPPSRLRFTGHEKDADMFALMYLHARFYMERQGKFTSLDPCRDVDPRLPQSWNLYAYVLDKPVGSTDPDGRLRNESPSGQGQQGPQSQEPQMENPWEAEDIKEFLNTLGNNYFTAFSRFPEDAKTGGGVIFTAASFRVPDFTDIAMAAQGLRALGKSGVAIGRLEDLKEFMKTPAAKEFEVLRLPDFLYSRKVNRLWLHDRVVVKGLRLKIVSPPSRGGEFEREMRQLWARDPEVYRHRTKIEGIDPFQ